jgi:hypothetical protein
LGYRKVNKRINGKQTKTWELTGTGATGATSFLEVGNIPVTHTQQGFEVGATGATGFSQTFPKEDETGVDFFPLPQESDNFRKVEKIPVAPVAVAESVAVPLLPVVTAVLPVSNTGSSSEAVLDSGASDDYTPKVGDTVELVEEHSLASKGTELEVIAIHGATYQCKRTVVRQNKPNDLKSVNVGIHCLIVVRRA